MFLVLEVNKDKDLKNDENLLQKFSYLQQKIKNIRICEIVSTTDIIYSGCLIYRNINLKYIYFSYYKETIESEFFSMSRLPAYKLRNLFDQLIYQNEIKIRILVHFYKILFMFKKKTDFSFFDISKTALIYGPPGTGKTSLAKAIFNRFSIRIKKKCYLMEINCNKIFNKFFGGTTNSFESLKKEIFNLSKDNFLLILFDEIESILISREIIINRNEPLESLRVINSFLLFLDKIKLNKKIFIIFTSNNYEKLEHAFLDRCDIKMLVDIPNQIIVKCILRNIFNRLIKLNLIVKNKLKEEDLQKFTIFFEGSSSRQIKKIIFEVLNVKFNTLSDIYAKLKSKFN